MRPRAGGAMSAQTTPLDGTPIRNAVHAAGHRSSVSCAERRQQPVTHQPALMPTAVRTLERVPRITLLRGTPPVSGRAELLETYCPVFFGAGRFFAIPAPPATFALVSLAIFM